MSGMEGASTYEGGSAKPGGWLRRAAPFLALAILSLRPADAQNLIPDPTLSLGVSAWRTGGALPERVEWNAGPGADGISGFGELTGLLGGPGTFGTTVCVPVEADTTYSWGGFLRFVEESEALAQFTVAFYPDAACTGPDVLALQSFSPGYSASSANLNTWHLTAGPDVLAPPGARSAAFEVALGYVSNRELTVHFDNLYFGRQGTMPPLAAAVATLDTAGLVLLAMALAAAGTYLSRVRA
jgi:hypothetical protein